MMAFLVVCAGAVALPPLDAHVVLEPPAIARHEGAVFSIVVESAADVSVTIPPMAGKFGGVRADGPVRTVEPLPDGRARTIEQYRLEPIEAGVYAIEPAIVQMGENLTHVIPSPALRVRDLSEDELETLAAVAPNAALRTPPSRTGVVVASVAVLAALLAMLWMMRRRGNAVGGPVEAPVAPWDAALARLDALDAQRLPEKGQFGPYYVQLSSISRRYIEDRFAVHAPEQTTPEFLEAASVGGFLTPEHEQLLAHFLRHADRVKFARYVPTVDEMRQGMDAVRRFVTDTAGSGEDAREDAA